MKRITSFSATRRLSCANVFQSILRHGRSERYWPPGTLHEVNPSGTPTNAIKGKAAMTTAETANRWTFLTNHAHVMIVLHNEPDLVLREVALRVGITERAVQRITQDLEAEGFILRQRIGRKNHYQVVTNLPLRHPIESHRTLGDLLNALK
ncbi:MAG: winged helix-turn-helix domain-containing protein [Pirellulaceae bacterium]